ncbi:polysaccharide pyruvyl transferase family protein [Agrococcus sp. 1P02AA]|uniref:polysaccharide pyruvyl transferase family protein n=1 Tax=Agrococcus sp. 1P02AA TaxID=3132259 RepID=UPI0039A642A3
MNDTAGAIDGMASADVDYSSIDIPSIEQQREGLRGAVFESEKKHRIVFVGRFFQGSTGIVASLHRALEGVGHTVFELEYARHRAAFDRSSGANGGYGPVFFRPEAVEAVFRSFRPEIVVFCAGGVVLDEEGQQWFKERGILTIGLTLSDPDVQDSVIDHIGRFDYHTTNAELSLDRYRAEGHSNTFLMPFGIDRDYILREVPPAPELTADAICIGHAAGRPERHEVMTRLAELVHVRVYGNGWPLPGAEPVSGDRLLQAAHEGMIHVNFPATRAGFTNVKCGVFETIGAGSILATARFDEMSHLFDYGDEILGYDDAEDLAQQIAALKADPVALERIRRKGFAKLLGHHLYEHRWLRLFADIEADLASEDGSKDSAERDRLSAILAVTHGRPRHVIISGFYGAQNRGDDLLLDAIAGSLQRADEDVNVIVAAVQPTEVERASGYQAFRRTDIHVAERFASMATSVILGAGGLWHDYTIAKAGGVSGIMTSAAVSPSHLVQLPLMVKAYGGSFHVYGMGVGPLTDEAAKAAVRLSGSLASSVTVRDDESKALLRGVADHWSAQPVVAPDAVYSLPIDTAEPSIDLPERYVLLNVRPWADNGASLRLRDVVLRIAERLGVAVVGLPMQNIDEKHLAAAEGETEMLTAMVPAGMSGPEFLGVIDGAAAIVSMRLHANLLAHRLGRPAVGFSYDEKVRSHFAQLGRSRMVLDLDAEEAEIEDAIRAALAEQELPLAVRERVRELEAASFDAIDGVARSIAAGPVQISPIAGMVHVPAETAKPTAKSADLGKVIWSDDQALDLGRARVSSGNALDAEATVEHRRKRVRGEDTFALDARAPRKGDFVEWDLVLPASEEGLRVELWIKQKYPERPRLRGYLAYTVTADDVELFTQDVTAWQPRNTVWVAMGPSLLQRHIKVRLHALRDCPDWNWGPASEMTIERGRKDAWHGDEALRWGASSPYAQDGAQPAFDALEQLAAATAASLRQVAGHIPAGAHAVEGAVSDAGTPIRFSAAQVRAGNLHDASREVDSFRSTSEAGDTFGLVEGAPKRGDFVDWRYRVRSVEGQGVRVELALQQKYGEIRNVAGHMAYSVMVGDEILFTQDITAWQPRNTVWIAVGPEHSDPVVTVRLHALKDCPDWKWGEASPLTVERGRALQWAGGMGLAWGASSPMALGLRAEPETATD